MGESCGKHSGYAARPHGARGAPRLEKISGAKIDWVRRRAAYRACIRYDRIDSPVPQESRCALVARNDRCSMYLRHARYRRTLNCGTYEGKAQTAPCAACALLRLVKLTVAAVRQLVTSAHQELKPVTFAAFVAADVYAADIADDFKISGTRLMPPRAIGVEDMPIFCGYALHALYLSKDWASREAAPQTLEA